EDTGWFFDTELLVLAERAGLRIHEVPVEWVDERHSVVDIVVTVMEDPQGSGKTLSMLFFSQKVLRKVPGNWSFVIVTDREDLDDQAHKEFLWAGVVTEKHVRATGSANLRQLLAEDHRYVFTLIHKFRTEKGETHPVVSDRDDVIVITDEA